VVYLPVSIISGRYAMPAVWGLDILFALLLTALWRQTANPVRSSALVAVGLGLLLVLSANVVRQERGATRARVLWAVVRHLESATPPGATIAWISGDPPTGGLGLEEGIHVQWHLAHRGRADIRIALFTPDEQQVNRAEVVPGAGDPVLRITGARSEPERVWEPDRSFEVVSQFGRKRYDCHISRRAPPPPFARANAKAGADLVVRAQAQSSP
jgi:hypothetical protein